MVYFCRPSQDAESGALKTREWKRQHQVAEVENALAGEFGVNAHEPPESVRFSLPSAASYDRPAERRRAHPQRPANPSSEEEMEHAERQRHQDVHDKT